MRMKSRPCVFLLLAFLFAMVQPSFAEDNDAKKLERPRVLFMIAEQNIGEEHFVFWWSWLRGGKSEYKAEVIEMTVSETVLKERFAKEGFNVVDRQVFSGAEVEITSPMRMVDLTAASAKDFGRIFAADVVVKGKAVAREGVKPAKDSLGVYMADISAAAIRVDDGRVLASGIGHGVSRHISPISGGVSALEKASAELSDELVDQIYTRWSLDHSVITINVSGITDYLEFIRLRDMLKRDIKGVESVYEKEFGEHSGVLEIEASRTFGEIAEDMANSKAMPLKVTKTTSSAIYISLTGQ
ncbi:MAG: hypothetical protein HY880_04750 [Deltaproteobacteria bacterium]|nr:hypothetical protein [Deltaproteobacteria bacterium]